jgi:hypothetical protein
VTGGDSFEPNLADEPEPYDDAPAPGDRFDSSIAEDRITAAMNIFDADRIDR